MSRTLRTLTAAVSASALAVAALAAAPTADSTTVTVDGDSVSVVGTLADGLGSHVIGVDAVGDSVFNGLGGDFSGMTVSFPRPGVVAYGVQIGDANPATGVMPHGLRVDLTGVAIGAQTFDLNATTNLDTGVRVGTTTCEEGPGGVTNCSSSPVDGGYADGTITWELPVTAGPGERVMGATALAKLAVGTGTTGGLYFNQPMDDVAISAMAAMPSARLLVDGELAAAATLSDAGFDVAVAGLAAGEHTLELELCGPAADFNGAHTECELLDLGPITIDG